MFCIGLVQGSFSPPNPLKNRVIGDTPNPGKGLRPLHSCSFPLEKEKNWGHPKPRQRAAPSALLLLDSYLCYIVHEGVPFWDGTGVTTRLGHIVLISSGTSSFVTIANMQLRGGDYDGEVGIYFSPASLARMMAPARSATCSLLKILET